MYSNVGKSIKGIVKIVISLSIGLSVILGILIIANIDNIGGRLVGILVAGLGSFMAWLSGLVLYAYGEITDRIMSIDEKISGKGQMNDGLDGPDDQTQVIDWDKVPQWQCSNCGTFNPEQRTYCLKCNTSREWSLQKDKKNSSWVCPYCDHVNDANNKFCVKCGAKIKL